MKNTLKSLIMLALVAFVSVTFTSCGDEESDPKPVVEKTDLELVKEAISGSEWVLKSAKVVANSQIFDYVGGTCNFSIFSTLGSQANLTATNVTDFKFKFTNTDVEYDETCGSILNTKTYTVTQNNDQFLIEFMIGSTLYKFSGTKSSLLSKSEVVVNRLNLVGSATESKLTFTKK